jgi:hypothetical protein
MSLTADEAARILGVAAHEVLKVEHRDGGWWAHHEDMASHTRTWRSVPGHELAASFAGLGDPAFAAAVDADAVTIACPACVLGECSIPEHQAVPVGDTDGDGVPDGAIAEVLEWVGEDHDRAVRALEAEGERPAPRTTLITALQKVTG